VAVSDDDYVVAFDSETYPITDRKQAPPPVVMQWLDERRLEPGQDPSLAVQMTTDQDEMLDQFQTWLADDRCHLVAHNTSFDAGVLLNASDADPVLCDLFFEALEDGRVHDTMYRHRLIKLATKGYSGNFIGLDKLVDRHFNVDISESKHDEFSWRTNYHYLDGVPLAEWPEDAIEYAQMDPVWAWKVYKAQGKEVTAPNGAEVAGPNGVIDEPLTVTMACQLQLSSIWGMKVNEDLGSQRAQELDADFEQIADSLTQIGFYTKRGPGDYKKNTQAVKDRVVQAYPQGEAPRTEKGNVRTAKEVLADSGDAALEKMAELSAVEKLRSTYKPIIEDGGSVHPGYDALKNTGRSSSFSPNIQNIPRGGAIRQCFEARPGYVYVLCDYSTLELRTLAQTCLDLFGESHLAEVFQSGRDPHSLLAADIRDISYDRQVAEENGQHGLKLAKTANNTRQFAKVPNYGVPGGMCNSESLQSYAAGMGIDIAISEADDAFDYFHDTWEVVDRYFGFIEDKTGWKDAMTVVYPRSERLRAKSSFTQAANALFQGPAADGGRLACHRLNQRCLARPDDVLYGSRLCAFVHDETITEVPQDRAHECAMAISETMETAMNRYTPDVDNEAEAALALRWFKSADPVYKPGGDELEVWLPHEQSDDGSIDFDDDELKYAEDRLGRSINYETRQ